MFSVAVRFFPLLLRLFFALLVVGHSLADDKGTLVDLRTRKDGFDWPCFLGPSGDNKSGEKGILTHWPETGPRIVWDKKIGMSFGGPSISRGRLFIFDRRGDQARLSCLKSETGDELWRFQYATDYEDMYGYNNGPRTTPVVDQERVYTFGVEGMLHCLEVEGGTVKWKVDTTARFGVVQNFFGVGSTPLVEGNLLIVLVGGSPPGSPTIQMGGVRGNGCGIVAFDKLSGDIVYKVTDELASYASPYVTTIHGRRWCFVFARGGLVGFEPSTGNVDFHYPWRAKILESVNASNPVVVGDEVFISEAYGPGSSLLRVKPGKYGVLWKDPAGREKAMQTHWNTPISHDGYLYGCSGRHTASAELRCIEWSTGRIRWSEPNLKRSSLLYVDGHFVCLTEGPNRRGQLLLIRATPERFDLVAAAHLRRKDGAALLEYPSWAAPVLSHGLLYVRGKDRLVCMELIPAVEK